LTTLSDLESAARDLFMELHRATDGNAQAQASMYTLGEAIGLDRDASAAAAEDLMAHGLVDIRTLSGAIGMSDQGASLMTDGNAGGSSNVLRLGTGSPLDASQCELVEQVLTRLKSELGQTGLAFEALSEMTADIRTIEAQMASPKPKTMIIRECFASLLGTAKANQQAEWGRTMEDLLG
jgi:hypothetical protein